MEKSEATTAATAPPQPETAAVPPAAAAPAASATACQPGEEKSTFPTNFARLFFGAVTLLVIYYSYLIIKPYLLDIFMALVLFFTARPLYNALCRLLWQRRALASALTCLILLLIILIPLFSLMSIIATQALEFSSQVTKAMQSGHVWPWIAAKIDALKAYLTHLDLPVPPGDIDLGKIIQTTVASASAFIYTNAIGLIKGFTYFLFDLLLVLFIAFFMFLQGDAFIAELMQLSPLEEAHNQEILHEAEVTIKATLWGTVIVAFVQGALGGVGFLIFGLPQPAFWGTVMIPAAVIPIVGSAIIWGPAAIYLMFTHHVAAGIGLVIWGGVLVSVIDNVLKPILVKGSGDTPSIFILFSILGGLTYFGMIGFILGPLILSFLLALLRIYRKTILLQPSAALALPAEKSASAGPPAE